LASGLNKGRGVVVCTTLLVIPHSRYFASMATLLTLSIGACSSFLLSMLVVLMLFAEAFHQIYKDVPTEDGPYFESFAQSMRMMFRIFTGEGWSSIMYDVAYETSEASKFLFMAYVFCSTMLFGQLVLGVIISVYDEIVTFTSTAIYGTLAPLYSHLNSKERGRIISDFMTVNCLLFDLHDKVQELSARGASSESRWLLVLQQQVMDAAEDVTEGMEKQRRGTSGLGDGIESSFGAGVGAGDAQAPPLPFVQAPSLPFASDPAPLPHNGDGANIREPAKLDTSQPSSAASSPRSDSPGGPANLERASGATPVHELIWTNVHVQDLEQSSPSEELVLGWC